MAKEKITMPQLGESVTEGTITAWLVKEGDRVDKYDPIVEVLTDKVNAEVPSSFSGTIIKISAQEGDTVPVGAILCEIETEEVKTEDTEKQETKAEVNTPNTEQPSMKKRYSPAVLRLAQEHDINLETVSGTGRGGRITRKDIEKIIQQRQAGLQETEKAAAPEVSKTQPKSKEIPMRAGDVEIPVTGIRKAIAQNMVKSKQEIPHAWMMVEADVTELVNYRNEIKEEFKQKEGISLTYFAFFVKAVATALKEFPELNSTWQGDTIVQHKDINISIAVAKENELYVPVIHRADELSIKGIARKIEELAEKVRTNRLTNEDISGGTFTVNNTGTFGSVQSMGIINYPQAAILQVEAIVKRPVIIDGMFAARDIVNLCLSLDHRILDGLICGRFMKRVKEILEGMDRNISVY